MAPKRRPSVLEAWSSQLSFIETDDELHRDFKSRPISIQPSRKGNANRTNSSKKKTTKKRPPAASSRHNPSPLEVLNVSNTSSHSPKRKAAPSSSPDSSSSSIDWSTPIPRKAKILPAPGGAAAAPIEDFDASRGSQGKYSAAATMLLLGQQRKSAESSTRNVDRVDEYTIPRKKPKAATDASKKPPLPSKKTKKGTITKNNDDHDDLADDIDMEIPYTQDFGAGQRSKSSALLGKPTEPLRAGDVIFYYNPVFVAGTKQAVTVTQILAIDPSVMKKNKKGQYESDVFPLDLENAAMIPTDTYISRIKEYRNGELFPHHGVRRQIQDFRLIPGKLIGKTGIERRMQAFKLIVAQAQQQLEDDLEKGHVPESNGDSKSSDNDSTSSDSSPDDSPLPSKATPSMRENNRELLLSKARRALASSLDGTDAFDTKTFVADKAHHQVSKKASQVTVRPKGLFEDESSSDDEEPSDPAANHKSSSKSTVSPKNAPKTTSVLDDSSDPDSDEEAPSQQRRILTKSQLKKQRRQAFKPSKSHQMNLNRSSQKTDNSKERSSAKSSFNDADSPDKELLLQRPKQASQLDPTASLDLRQTRRPRDPLMQGLDDSTDDDDDNLLLNSGLKRTTGSNGSSQRRPDSDSVPATTKNNAKRIKSFLHISPTNGEERDSKSLSETMARRQQEEFDMILHGAAQSTSAKPVTVKRSTSSFQPRSVEDASSCNEFANDSTSDEDNETFFRKRKESRNQQNSDGPSRDNAAKVKKKHDDLGSITTTFSSQSSADRMNNSKKKISKASAGAFRLSSLKRPKNRPSHRQPRMELQLQPIPQGDIF
jgi:hypothetical protein